MELTSELLQGLGFVETDNAWVDDFCRVYKNQLPPTLVQFKNLLTGKSFNKGLEKGKRVYAASQTEDLAETYNTGPVHY